MKTRTRALLQDVIKRLTTWCRLDLFIGRRCTLEKLVLPIVPELLQKSVHGKIAFTVWAVLIKFIYPFLSNVVKKWKLWFSERMIMDNLIIKAVKKKSF